MPPYPYGIVTWTLPSRKPQVPWQLLKAGKRR